MPLQLPPLSIWGESCTRAIPLLPPRAAVGAPLSLPAHAVPGQSVLLYECSGRSPKNPRKPLISAQGAAGARGRGRLAPGMLVAATRGARQQSLPSPAPGCPCADPAACAASFHPDRGREVVAAWSRIWDGRLLGHTPRSLAVPGREEQPERPHCFTRFSASDLPRQNGDGTREAGRAWLTRSATSRRGYG